MLLFLKHVLSRVTHNTRYFQEKDIYIYRKYCAYSFDTFISILDKWMLYIKWKNREKTSNQSSGKLKPKKKKKKK